MDFLFDAEIACKHPFFNGCHNLTGAKVTLKDEVTCADDSVIVSHDVEYTVEELWHAEHGHHGGFKLSADGFATVYCWDVSHLLLVAATLTRPEKA